MSSGPTRSTDGPAFDRSLVAYARATARQLSPTDRIAAEELVGAILLRFAMELDRKGRIEPRLIPSIARSAAIDELRRWTGYSRRLATSPTIMPFGELDDWRVFGTSPSAETEALELVYVTDLLRRFRDRYSIRHATVLAGRMTGAPLAETGQILGVSEARVSQIFERIRQAFVSTR